MRMLSQYFLALGAFSIVALGAGCADSDTKTDTGTGTGTGTDTGTDTDTDTDVAEVRIDVAGFYPEGVAIDAASNTLFVGSFGTGAVYRASLTDGLASELVAPFGLGGVLAGLKVADGALWACVNPADVSVEASRLVKVDPETGEALASYTLSLYTFCNDLVRAPSGDVYVTDSFQSLIFRLPAGGSALEVWFSDAAYAPAPGSFGFNGIEMAPDASAVLVGRADTGEIVRVPVESDGAAGPATTDTMPGPVSYGGVDGMVWSGDELLAVRDYQVVSLTASGTTWSSTLVDATLDAPTTVAVDSDGGVWVVESQFSKLFDGDDSTNGVAPYRVVRVRR